MSIDIIKPNNPQFNTISEQIKNSNRYYPFFKNCIEVIDGTHVATHLPADRVQSYIERKGYATQNIMTIYSFDLTFTFVMTGWEGTAHDSRIFNSIINNRNINIPHPPPGQYYLVHSGYPLIEGYLPPYRNVRYHIPDFRETQNQQKTENKIFNFYHSNLRMAIERIFGIWKEKN